MFSLLTNIYHEQQHSAEFYHEVTCNYVAAEVIPI